MEPDRPWADIRALEEADRDRDAEDREDIRRLRSEYGLPVDDEVVEHFLAEHKAGRQEEGMWLTPDEWERYERQDQVQTEAEERLRGYLAEHADSVAGVWLGVGLEPEYNVAFTSDVDAHREALLRLFPRPDVLKVHHRRDARELETLADRISEESDEREVTKAPWQLWTLDSTGHELTVHYSTSPADEFERIDATENEHEVRVTLFERAYLGAQKAIAAYREAMVELERPLGNRRVIDGATGRIRERRIRM